MPQGPKLSSPTSNIPHPQQQQQQAQQHQRLPQGSWTRPPLDRSEERSTDTMANISMWNAASLPENLPGTSATHMPRGGADATQYQQHQQVQGKGMGRDTSPMRSPIGNSPQFRLSPSMEDYGMQQGGGMGLQTSQPQAMPRRLSNPSEVCQSVICCIVTLFYDPGYCGYVAILIGHKTLSVHIVPLYQPNRVWFTK